MRQLFDGQAKWIWAEKGEWQAGIEEASPIKTCYFRRSFVSPKNAKLSLHVSADSRYVLYINGLRLASGPAKGDIAHQFYDTLNVSVSKGVNFIAAAVTSFSAVYPDYSGTSVPVSIMTAMPGFIADAVLYDEQDRQIEALHTDEHWEVLVDKSVSHMPSTDHPVISDMNECIDYKNYPEGWQTGADGFKGWHKARSLSHGVRADTVVDSPLPFRLTSRLISRLSEIEEGFSTVLWTKNIGRQDAEQLIKVQDTMNIPSGTKAEFIVATEKLTTAYPVLSFASGEGSFVKLIYSEALWQEGKKVTSADIEGDVKGMFDCFIADGRTHTFEPSHWRTFRYVKVIAETGSQPLTIARLSCRFTGYPIEYKAIFESSQPLHKKIMDVSFRTLQLCCHETYEDCPYYEQMQYAGDTQVISLVNGYISGDWSLTKQAILQFYWSLDYEGFPQSRYPSRIPQKIISWALLWAVMVHDYYMHTGDMETAGECMKGVTRTLEWFYRFIGERGLLKNLPYWKFVDWVWEWNERGGSPPGAIGGTTGLISAQYAYALGCAAKLLNEFGDSEKAVEYQRVKGKIAESVNKYCWDEVRGLYKDSPDHELYSELGNAWAILAGCADNERAKTVCLKFESDPCIAKATLYGRFYVFRALSQSGCYDKFGDILKLWYEMLSKNITTWPEEPWFNRSFCHAWSCSPVYEFLAEILGVKPLTPGFGKVIIEPKDCGLSYAFGAIPTVKGNISVNWHIKDGVMNINAVVPKGVEAICRTNRKSVFKVTTVEQI